MAGVGDRVVAADDLTEIAAGGKLVVHAAIANDKSLAAALLPIDNAGEIDSRLAHQPATELKRKSGPAQRYWPGSQSLAERRTDPLDIKRLVSGEIRDANAAAKIDERRDQARSAEQRVGDGGGSEGRSR